MAAATAINAEAFTNRAMAENNSANCLNTFGLEPNNTHTLDKGTVLLYLSNENDEDTMETHQPLLR